MNNVYATNMFKYFYTQPPAYTGVLSKHVKENLTLLKKEIASYPDAVIITLGEPVLQLLVNAKMNYYWDYVKKTRKNTADYKKCGGVFKKCSAENELLREFYPFPHQPSLRKDFYKDNLDNYLRYMKK